MIRPNKAPDSSCISRKLFLKILRSASVFRFSPSATIFLSIQALDERASRAITTLLPPYSQPNSHISWIGMLLRRERVEETIEIVNAGEIDQFLRLSDFMPLHGLHRRNLGRYVTSAMSADKKSSHVFQGRT